ncbi:hypothetical protein J1605_004020 [Eschrichtius robustus]|uniref:Uncharacterized protein n=1 Tax=Eschrichtius robustus TaxID=9764 RepID=A0AB34HP28_ESCRO|nr:hypothetical protein J1605_004020 [Eschrichtius robustus]
MWDLPRPGLEPVSPALAGRFSTTAPPGKPSMSLNKGDWDLQAWLRGSLCPASVYWGHQARTRAYGGLKVTGSRRSGSVVVAHGPSRSAACGIFPDQGSNPCPLHWQADSQPLRHQGSPEVTING